MTQKDFVALVKNMREAQKEYFRTRRAEQLSVAKVYETRVDRAIKEMENNQIKMF